MTALMGANHFYKRRLKERLRREVDSTTVFDGHMTPAPELIDIVLKELQRALCENLHCPWEAQCSKPPQYGYVEQTEFKENDLKMGKALAAWYISPDSVHASPLKDRQSPKIDGVFFNLFLGWFCFSPDLAAVFINWQTGPRFGKGFRHRVGRDAARLYLLDRGENTWVS